MVKPVSPVSHYESDISEFDTGTAILIESCFISGSGVKTIRRNSHFAMRAYPFIRQYNLAFASGADPTARREFLSVVFYQFEQRRDLVERWALRNLTGVPIHSMYPSSLISEADCGSA
jgi:hypothetical protein